MLKTHHNDRFVWFLLGALAASAAVAEEPRELLQRMNEALMERNYDGVFQHQQGRKVEVLRIVHRVKDGKLMERLVSLNGTGREFIRSGNELTCYLPDKRLAIVERHTGERPLLGNFPRFDESSTEFYDVREVRRTRFLGRHTRVIAVEPKDEFRYGYRLWIDEETAMPLKTQLCDANGRVIESLKLVADLKVARSAVSIPDSAFEPEVSTEGFRWVRAEREPPREAVAAVDNWSAEGLPPGFRMTVRSAQMMPGSRDPVTQLVFSDGLASVSVFVESRTRVPPERESGGLPAGAVQVGSTSAFSTIKNGRRVTVLGDGVPPETVRAIANSVQPAAPSRSSAPALSIGSPSR